MVVKEIILNLLINFSTLKSGGGQNVAMNFLHAIDTMKLDDINLYFFIAEDSDIHSYFLDKEKTNFYAVPNDPIKRIIFEMFNSQKILLKEKIDIIYSYFGIGFFTKKIPQVSGSADSNLFFPEVDFWSQYHGISRLKKYIIDQYRIWGIKRASAVVFENEVLEKRAIELYDLKLTKTIKPSVNFDLESKKYTLPEYINTSIPKGLFLCGWQYNKNIMLIPEIASEFKKNNIEFHFLLTAPLDNSEMHNSFSNLVNKYHVEDIVSVVGSVKKEELASLYEKIDYVFLLSKLESFSNNIIESWYFDKVLVVADEPWSRGICKSAAVYVDRDSVEDIANKLRHCINDDNTVKNILAEGKMMLKKYPSIEQRITMEMEFIKYVYENS
jgi:glycosyltransferase involved in cell wall biosynthesis